MNEQTSNDLSLIVAQAIEEIKDEQGTNFDSDHLSQPQSAQLRKPIPGH